MENFVLNLFSDQLSRIIKDFSSSQINANFLSGKGSIRNVKLNTDLINDFLNKPPHGTVPFLEFTEITLTELRVEVTSYTNLKKAPIVLVIEEIHAKAREPLEYHVDPALNLAHKKKSESAAAATTNKKNPSSPPQQYGLLHRILDNLSVKIKRIHLSFSSLGKFKTRRQGPWTPPTLQVCFDNVEWISVTESGHHGTPDAVWAHNELSAQQSRYKNSNQQQQYQHRHRSYVIYKRLSMMCSVKLLSGVGSDASSIKKGTASKEQHSISNLISDTRVDLHVAYTRRLRDAGVAAADLDVQVYDVNIDLDVAAYSKSKGSIPTGCDVGDFVHMMIGLAHCYYKDRSFVDPLLANGVLAPSNKSDDSGLLRGFSQQDTVAHSIKVDEEVGPDDFLPTIKMDEDDSESESDYDDEEEEDQDETGEHDEAYLAWKRSQEGQNESENAEQTEAALSETPVDGTQTEHQTSDIEGAKKEKKEKKETTDKSYKRKRKAVIVIASGAQQFEKLSFSLSIPRINMKLCIPSEGGNNSDTADPNTADKDESNNHHHCLELLLEGLLAECIWPKTSGEMGGHVQGSIKYMHVLESVFQKEWGSKSGTFGPMPWNVVKLFPLFRVGRRLFEGHDSFSLSSQLTGSQDIKQGESFVQMEDRGTTWTWDRRLQGPQALAFKSTISFFDEKVTQWSKTSVQHEASAGELEIILNSSPVERLVTLFSDPTDQDNVWFDGRWLTGEWQDVISTNMIESGNTNFHLKDYIQPLPSLYPSKGGKQSALSSELRSITAHFDSVTVCLPNPKQHISSFRMADVIFHISEATIIVSKHLPSSFLAGEITTENTTHTFPHDATDITCAVQDTNAQEETTQFRMQLSLLGCSLKVVPVQVYSLSQISNLISPTNVTMMLSLEHKDSGEHSTSNIDDSQSSKIISFLIQTVQSNVELRSLYGALETFTHHAESIMKCCSSGDKIDNKSADNDASTSSTILCMHVPEVEINLWGEQPNNTTETTPALLVRVRATQFEFGMERKIISQITFSSKNSVFKCAISSVSLELCSQLGEHKMVEIFSFGNQSHGSQLVEKARAFCLEGDVDNKDKRTGFLLRSESEVSSGFNASTSASSVEISSSMSLDVNIKAIETALNLVLEGLLSPVFISRGQIIGQRMLGSALWAIVAKLYYLFSSSPDQQETGVNKDIALFRMSLQQLLVLIPSAGDHAFGLSFNDVEIATGTSGATDSAAYRTIIEKSCCHENRTWLEAYNLLNREGVSDFYALKSRHSLFRSIAKGPVNTLEFETMFPASSINWSLPEGIINGVSISPPFDVFAIKDLSMAFMTMGMPLSSLYFKLYKLTPQNESAQSEFSIAAARLHDDMGNYHNKTSLVIGQISAEVDRLRRVVWLKENERIGALALASSTACGYVRVGEDLSFSHRLFSSATFWRYWMVLDKSSLILYKEPGSSTPSFVIPLRKSSQLRSIEISSSSSSKANSIVGNHVQQKGFAVIDSAESGTGLFFVTSNEGEHNMWVGAISTALLKKKDDTDDTPDSKQLLMNDSLIVNDGINQSNSSDFGVVDAGTPTPSDLMELEVQPTAAPRSQDTTTEPTPSVAAQGPSPADPIESPLDSSEGMMEDVNMMEDVDMTMEEISLDNTNGSIPQPERVEPEQTPTSSAQYTAVESQINTTQSLPMRERLALAKGKSKLATSKLGSAMKSAKGGLVSAGSEIRQSERSIAVGQKMSMLKRNANTKLSAAKTSLQNQVIARETDISSTANDDSTTDVSLPSSTSPDRKLVAVGEKMSLLKKNANAKLTGMASVRTPGFSLSSSQDEVVSNTNKFSKQDLIRKKLVNLDQSMSNTVRRLKIDEKVTQLSTAVKNDSMVKQISSSVSRRTIHRGDEHSTRQRLGIGEENKAPKPIKFDARETFSASSDLPLRVKATPSYGDDLLVERLSEEVKTLHRVQGNWTVTVHLIKVVIDTKLENAVNEVPDNAILPLDNKWKFTIVMSDMSTGSTDDRITASVERSLTELLSFHTHISEIITSHLPSMSEFSSQGGFNSFIFEKLSPLDRLRVAGKLLHRVLKLNGISDSSSNSSIRDNQCDLIKMFVSTLLECHLPEQAISATKVFLNMSQLSSLQESNDNDSMAYLTSNGQSYDKLDIVTSTSSSLDKQSIHTSSGSFDTAQQSSHNESLLNVIMEGYSKAVLERDEALASLATTSIINDNRIMQEQLRKSKGNQQSQAIKKGSNSDEEMLNLCKQLGNEIALRTTAEAEINRLNERLEFEQKIAQAKNKELSAKLAMYEKGT